MTIVPPSEPAVPAGWYRDPLGIPQLRWWNGVAWTNRIQEDRAEFNTWSLDYADTSASAAEALPRGGRHTAVA